MDRLQWFRQAKFGMFIHWGLYAVAAGHWRGKPVPWLGEWIMRQARIPVKEYRTLARQFNPVAFDASAWVQLAKEAQMRYLVVTAKHHDGFAMYHSQASSYNVVDATPFGRDPLRELADECHKQDIRFCLYYSHCIDWDEAGAVGNFWDFPENEDDIQRFWDRDMESIAASKPGFDEYLQRKALPQMRELLTNYGPIGLIWYDMPVRISKEQCQPFIDVVEQLQPSCLISGRIGYDLGDYVSPRDNEIPEQPPRGPWETCMTLNDTWGYKSDDCHWKSSSRLLEMLSRTHRKGGNFLLNIGPTAEGLIPPASVARLREMGQALQQKS